MTDDTTTTTSPQDARIAELEAQLADETARADAAEQDRDTAHADLAKATTAAKKAERAAKPAALRKLGPIEPDRKLDRDAIKAKLAGAETIEVAFSDGVREIEGLATAPSIATAWREHPLGMMLADPVELIGPGPDQSAYGIQGYALLIDGKQIAYTARSEQLNVAPGRTVKLENDINF